METGVRASVNAAEGWSAGGAPFWRTGKGKGRRDQPFRTVRKAGYTPLPARYALLQPGYTSLPTLVDRSTTEVHPPTYPGRPLYNPGTPPYLPW